MPPSSASCCCRLIIFIALFLAVQVSRASAPWVETGDQQARHHIETLHAMGCLAAPTMTWPISWSAVIRAYQKGAAQFADGHCDNTHSRYLLQRYREQKSDQRGLSVRLGGSNQEPLFRDFNTAPEDERVAGLSVYQRGEHWAVRLSGNYVEGDRDTRQWRPDDSYMAVLAGNWQLGAGAIDRWWGPGWYSALSLSNNARPVPGVWLSRQIHSAPETPWLSWLGPWDLQLIAGQLESKRQIPDGKLLGGRLVLNPHPRFQLGLTRLVQWGGEGRRQDGRSLWEVFIGKTNGESDGFAPEEGQGNQLAGFDFRYATQWSWLPVGVYGSFIGEDEAGYLPSKYASLVGTDLVTTLGTGSQRWVIEYTDTVAGLWGSEQRTNVMYEHSAYESGYRYYGRNLASTWESDAQVLTLGVQQYFAKGVRVSVDVSSATLNKGRSKRAVVHSDGPEILQADGKQDMVLSRFRLHHPLLGGELAWQLSVTDEPVVTYFSERERVTAAVQWTRNFNF